MVSSARGYHIGVSLWCREEERFSLGKHSIRETSIKYGKNQNNKNVLLGWNLSLTITKTQPSGIKNNLINDSDPPAARRAGTWSPYSYFLIVFMASGFARGRVRTIATTEWRSSRHLEASFFFKGLFNFQNPLSAVYIIQCNDHSCCIVLFLRSLDNSLLWIYW